jgi:hypothetical protein
MRAAGEAQARRARRRAIAHEADGVADRKVEPVAEADA